MNRFRKAAIAVAVLGAAACGLNLDSVSTENDLNSPSQNGVDDSGATIVVLPDGAIAILLDGALVPYDGSLPIDDSGSIVDTGVVVDTGPEDTGVPVVDSGIDSGADAGGCNANEAYCPAKMKCIAGLTCNEDCESTITCVLPAGAQCLKQNDCYAAIGGASCTTAMDCPVDSNVCADIGGGQKRCLPCMGILDNQSCKVGKCTRKMFVAVCE